MAGMHNTSVSIFLTTPNYDGKILNKFCHPADIMDHKTDILIIGAGPIGLSQALALKKINPLLKIVVLEKYARYQRNHVLNMQAQHLEALMLATDTEREPRLIDLLTQLKKDPHILTTDLQDIFTQIAEENGVEIKTRQEVKPTTLPQILAESYPNLRLIIGADGTHSVTSHTLFSADNQVKYEFDYVLQMRYEIDGPQKAANVDKQYFYQQVLRKGLVANEYVGQFAQGKTPITLQMMISREDFLRLQSAKSNTPLKPFADTPPEVTLPTKLQSFITYYLQNRIACLPKNYSINQQNIRISVNEAPATHAKQIVTQHGNARVILVGDAALGLSYFKGLNAGIEAMTQFFTLLKPAIQDGFHNIQLVDNLLNRYQQWFLQQFAPRKIKEVANYSFWQIRSLMEITRTTQRTFNASVADYDENFAPSIQDYFDHYSEDLLNRNRALNNAWNPFPHRAYPIAQFAQWSYVPLQYTGKKIFKLFADYVKPYKSQQHIIQDFKQPLVGLGNMIIGLGKILVGIWSLQGWLCLDGLCTVIRGLLELITTPLTWLIKPICRTLATYFHGHYKQIEDNTQLQSIAQQGQAYLNSAENLHDPETIINLLAFCNDLHRKFTKQCARGQSTMIELEECTQYASIRSGHVLDQQKLNGYFSLFSTKKSAVINENAAMIASIANNH